MLTPVTDIFSLVDGRLTNISFSNEANTSIRTLRNFYVYAEDIDADGVLELPSLLTMKPVIYVANMADSAFDLTSPRYLAVADFAAKEHSEVLPICARIEEEISELEEEEKGMFLEDMGLKESGCDRLIKTWVFPKADFPA